MLSLRAWIAFAAVAVCAVRMPDARAASLLPPVTMDDVRNDIIPSEHVHVLKVYSDMCGSCTEFTPAFTEVMDKHRKNFIFAGVNVDKKQGLKVAQYLDALNDGLPAVIVVSEQGEPPFNAIVAGDGVSAAVLEKRLLAAVRGLEQDAQGIYLKRGSDNGNNNKSNGNHDHKDEL